MNTYRLLNMEDAAKFWPSVAVKDDPGACWEWTGARSYKGTGISGGYGLFRIHGTSLTATRVVFALLHGEPAPSGMVLMHTCDNPPCCNPAHLKLGTHAENMADMDRKGRRRLRRKLFLARKQRESLNVLS